MSLLNRIQHGNFSHTQIEHNVSFILCKLILVIETCQPTLEWDNYKELLNSITTFHNFI